MPIAAPLNMQSATGVAVAAASGLVEILEVAGCQGARQIVVKVWDPGALGATFGTNGLKARVNWDSSQGTDSGGPNYEPIAQASGAIATSEAFAACMIIALPNGASWPTPGCALFLDADTFDATISVKAWPVFDFDNERIDPSGMRTTMPGE